MSRSRVSPDLGGLRTELDGILSAALGKAALSAKKQMEATARRATGGSGRLSGVGRKGARLGAGYDYVKGSRGKTVAVYANGPWQLVEYGRQGGYRIPKRRGTGPNRARRGAPRLHLSNGAWRTGPFSGGRLGGHAFWNADQPDVMAAMGDELAKAVIQTLDRW